MAIRFIDPETKQEIVVDTVEEYRAITGKAPATRTTDTRTQKERDDWTQAYWADRCPN